MTATRQRCTSWVAVDLFQRAAEGQSLTIIAERLGWFNGRGTPDTTRVSRALGLRPDSDGRTSRYMTLDMAERMCVGLDVYPRDMGI